MSSSEEVSHNCAALALVRVLFVPSRDTTSSSVLSHSLDVESLPLRFKEAVKVIVTEEVVDVINLHPCTLCIACHIGVISLQTWR